MKRTRLILSFAILLSTTVSSSMADELEPSINEKLVSAIRAASVIPQGDNVLVNAAGKEAAVSTYRAAGANLRDCKIDAAMIAKALMVDNNFGLARVRVQFHEPAGTSRNMQEVVVTLAEIKGFAAGTVTKDEFLESLDLKSIPEQFALEPPKPALNEPASASESTNTSPAGDKPKQTVQPKAAVEPARVHMVSRRTGIAFDVPPGWTFTENASGPSVFILHSTRTDQDNIELKFNVDAYTPEQRAQYSRAKFNYPGVSVKRYLPGTNFGTGPYPGSLFVCTYPNYDDNERPYYEMLLHFGRYTLHGWCGVTAYNTVGAAFDEIVRSMTFPTTQSKKPSPAMVKKGKPK